jgi:integrase
MLNEMERKVGRAAVGYGDPFEEHRKRPLAEHLTDFEAGLLAEGDTPKQAVPVAARVRRVLGGRGFVFMGDMSACHVMEYLATLRDGGRALPPLESGKGEFTLGELAAALGSRAHAVKGLVRRHGLEARGNGKARRFPPATLPALRERLARGASVQTVNFYLQAVKQFCRWLLKDRRMGDNPLAHLQGGNVKTDRRHDRRELDAEELRRLLPAARDSDRPFCGLTGTARFHLYATACGTGFRASALASLTPESFDLSADLPTVTLASRHAKNRKTKVQPHPPDLAGLLREYLRDRPAGLPVLGGTWASDNTGAEMLRRDLEAAGIAYTVEGPDGPQYADFHSLRHSFLILGGRAGIDLRTLQELAGHSTPALTARYSHRRLYDLAGAAEKLPSFLPLSGDGSEPAALRATGTEGPAAPFQLPASCSPVAQASARECEGMTAREGTRAAHAATGGDVSPSVDKGLRADAGESERVKGIRLAGFEPATFGSVDGNPDPPNGRKNTGISRYFALIRPELQAFASVFRCLRENAEFPRGFEGAGDCSAESSAHFRAAGSARQPNPQHHPHPRQPGDDYLGPGVQVPHVAPGASQGRAPVEGTGHPGDHLAGLGRGRLVRGQGLGGLAGPMAEQPEADRLVGGLGDGYHGWGSSDERRDRRR